MRKIFTITVFLTNCLFAFGQRVSVDTLFIPKPFGEFTQGEKLRFPVIRSDNPKIDQLINKDLKNRFTNNEFPELPTDSTLIKWGDNRIAYLNFEVTYLKNGLVSLNINAEGCGANCSGWTDFFTYSLITGKHITIDEIIDTTGKFRTLVFSDKDKQYEQQRVELKKIRFDKDSDLDEDTYKWALEQYNNCDTQFALNAFALYPDYLEIVEECYLPNAIKNLTPTIELKYKYVDIKDYLKIKN